MICIRSIPKKKYFYTYVHTNICIYSLYKIQIHIDLILKYSTIVHIYKNTYYICMYIKLKALTKQFANLMDFREKNHWKNIKKNGWIRFKFNATQKREKSNKTITYEFYFTKYFVFSQSKCWNIQVGSLIVRSIDFFEYLISFEVILFRIYFLPQLKETKFPVKFFDF